MTKTAICPYPDISVAILDNAANAAINQHIFYHKSSEAVRDKMAYAVVGSDPEAAILGLCYTSHIVIDEAIADIVVYEARRRLVIQTVSVCPNPERPVPGAENISYVNSIHAREVPWD
jgi:hypothetical protein